MESQLQSLIDKIKTDGVAEAERQAKDVIAEAERKAQRIVSDAERQAETILERAQQDRVRMEEAGKKAMEQAGRNLVLSLEKSITELFGRVFQTQVKTALTSDVLSGILDKIVSKWDPEKGIEVALSPQDAEVLTKGLLGRLQEKAKRGVVLKPMDSVDAGFFIGDRDGDLYYDFTHRGIAETLSQYLNPLLAEILKKGTE